VRPLADEGVPGTTRGPDDVLGRTRVADPCEGPGLEPEPDGGGTEPIFGTRRPEDDEGAERAVEAGGLVAGDVPARGLAPGL
jgi:hypothetical protein